MRRGTRPSGVASSSRRRTCGATRAQTQLILDLLPQVGEVAASTSRSTAMLTREDDPRWVPELGGGALLDVGCYCVSAARLLLGEPERVHGEARIGRGGVDTQFAGTLRFGDVTATFQCGLRSAFSNTLEVIGTEGILRVPSPFVDPPGVVVVNGEEHRVDAGNHYRAELETSAPRSAASAPCCSAATRCAGRRGTGRAPALASRLALLAGVQQVLRVEGLLHPQVQVVAGRSELVLELAALQPADAVLAGDRAAEAQRELEQLVARVVGALFLVEVLRREEERRVDVAVAGVTERERGDVVPLADLERLARDVAQPVERDCDVLAVRAAALREDRERRAAAPPPQVGDLGRALSGSALRPTRPRALPRAPPRRGALLPRRRRLR